MPCSRCFPAHPTEATEHHKSFVWRWVSLGVGEAGEAEDRRKTRFLRRARRKVRSLTATEYQ